MVSRWYGGGAGGAAVCRKGTRENAASTQTVVAVEAENFRIEAVGVERGSCSGRLIYENRRGGVPTTAGEPARPVMPALPGTRTPRRACPPGTGRQAVVVRAVGGRR